MGLTGGGVFVGGRHTGSDRDVRGVYAHASRYYLLFAVLIPAEVYILALQLGALYVLGSYATSRLAGLGASRGIAGSLLFYLLVMPGVVVHESAHYLACRLTGTPVGRFVPFAPRTDKSGRTVLGYVEHAPRNPVVAAIIGLAPVVVNPLLLVLLTSLMTPLAAGADVGANQLPLTAVGTPGLVSGLWEQVKVFAGDSPGVFALWSYLAVSLALGSCPSREDLVAVPAAALLVCAGAGAYALSSVPASLPPSGRLPRRRVPCTCCR